MAGGCPGRLHELLMMVIRSSQVQAGGRSKGGHEADPLQERAAELFAEQLAADRVPSARLIRAQLHIGQSRAQRAAELFAEILPADRVPSICAIRAQSHVDQPRAQPASVPCLRGQGAVGKARRIADVRLAEPTALKTFTVTL